MWKRVKADPVEPVVDEVADEQLEAEASAPEAVEVPTLEQLEARVAQLKEQRRIAGRLDRDAVPGIQRDLSEAVAALAQLTSE